MNVNEKFLYHILIDRFAGCDPNRKGRCFKGGNLRGIIDRLDYIESLGCNGIMLTPFYKTNEYHGYHILDYDKVDEHFGTWSDVDELVQAVHKRKMTITADFVANHCHINNPVVKQHPNWFKHRKDGSFVCLANIDYLPQFNLDIKGARDFIIEKGKKLCEYGFDAIRLDYAKGPSLNFWKRFRKDIKRDNPKVMLIGEVWGTPIGKHLAPKLADEVAAGHMTKQEAWQKSYIGILDGVLDFEYQSLLCHAVRQKQSLMSNEKLRADIASHFRHYADVPDFQLWLFLDNHDTNRFLYECSGDVELLKEAIVFSRRQSMSYILYYGTEKGMAHRENRFNGEPYADEQVRECMKWNNK